MPANTKVATIKFVGDISDVEKKQRKIEQTQTTGRGAARIKAQRQQKETLKGYSFATKETIAQATQATKQLRTQQRITQELRKQVREMRARAGGAAQAFGGGMAGQFAGGGGGVSAGGLGGAAGHVGKRVAQFAGGAAVGVVGAQMYKGYNKYIEYNKTLAGLTGAGLNKEQARGMAVGGGRFGYGVTETLEQGRQVGRLTGTPQAVEQAQALTRATTMDFGESSNLMGLMARGGAGFDKDKGEKGGRKLQKIMALGMESGLKKSRAPEAFKSIQTLMQRRMEYDAGEITGENVAKLVSAFGRTGVPGLQGERGANMISRLDQAIRQPGGGEVGQAFMLQAFGYGKPGGDASYTEALRRQQEGIVGKGGAQNLQDMFAEATRQYGGGEERTLMLSKLTGLTMRQVDQVAAAVETESPEAREKALAKIIKDARPVEQKALEAQTNGFSEVNTQLAKIEKHTLKIGDTIAPKIIEIEHHINQLVNALLPAIKAAVETTSELITGITYMLDKFSEDDPEKLVKQTQDIDQRLANIREEVSSGEMSEDEGIIKMKGLLETRKRIQQKITDPGLLTMVTEGLGKIGGKLLLGTFASDKQTTLDKRVAAISAGGQNIKRHEKYIEQMKKRKERQQEAAQLENMAAQGPLTPEEADRLSALQERLNKPMTETMMAMPDLVSSVAPNVRGTRGLGGGAPQTKAEKKLTKKPGEALDVVVGDIEIEKTKSKKRKKGAALNALLSDVISSGEQNTGADIEQYMKGKKGTAKEGTALSSDAAYQSVLAEQRRTTSVQQETLEVTRELSKAITNKQADTDRAIAVGQTNSMRHGPATTPSDGRT